MANLATTNSDDSNKSMSGNSEFRVTARNAEQQLTRVAQKTGEKVGAMVSDLSTATSDSLKASREYIRENPVKGAAIAAATGLVVGGLLSMAMRRRS